MSYILFIKKSGFKVFEHFPMTLLGHFHHFLPFLDRNSLAFHLPSGMGWQRQQRSSSGGAHTERDAAAELLAMNSRDLRSTEATHWEMWDMGSIGIVFFVF
jgi:hypothetical protein